MLTDGVEKRHDRRYRYLLAIKAGRLDGLGLLDGLVENVSLGGCLVRFKEPVCLSDQEIVEIFLRSDYLMILAQATVQRKTELSCLTGIRFLRMSDRGQMDLMELIDELARKSD